MIFAVLGAMPLKPALAAGAVMQAIRGETMGTTWSVKYFPPAATNFSNAMARGLVQAELDRLEAQMSNYRADSVVSRFNACAETNWFPVPIETARVVAEALEISRRTEGAFDITVAPLVRLWGFGPRRRTGVVPTDAAIAEALTRVGWRHLEVRGAAASTGASKNERGTANVGAALRKRIVGLEIDLGGIAKGFAAETVSELLRQRGVTNHLFGIGGDLQARGPGPTGNGWRVGIENPLAATNGLARVIALRDAALSTSGNYRNFFTTNGKRYGHIVDPRSGRPVLAGVASVAVVAPRGTHADALATGLFVLGEKHALQFAERDGVAVWLMLEGADGRAGERMSAVFERLGE